MTGLKKEIENQPGLKKFNLNLILTYWCNIYVLQASLSNLTQDVYRGFNTH